MSTFSAKKALLAAGGVNIDKVFATKLYDVAGGLPPSTVVATDFSPDILLTKSRNTSAGAGGNLLLDSIRPDSILQVQSTGAALTTGNYGKVTSTGAIAGRNGSAYSDVGWFFRRKRKFFDRVTYTGNGVAGRVIPHALGISPGMMVVKRLNDASVWAVRHRAFVDPVNFIDLSQSGFAGNNGGNSVQAMDAYGFTLAANNLNVSGATYVAYIWAHDTAGNGVIQCGVYSGNSSSTGPVIALGWEPQWLLIKNISINGYDWVVLDNKRSVSNPRNAVLRFNLPDAELVSANFAVDFLTTGFQPKTFSTQVTTSGYNYIYMAIRKGKA